MADTDMLIIYTCNRELNCRKQNDGKQKQLNGNYTKNIPQPILESNNKSFLSDCHSKCKYYVVVNNH